MGGQVRELQHRKRLPQRARTFFEDPRTDLGGGGQDKVRFLGVLPDEVTRSKAFGASPEAEELLGGERVHWMTIDSHDARAGNLCAFTQAALQQSLHEGAAADIA